jgi:hypothetical protein
MTAADFRRMALSLEGAEEGSHMGAVDFRVGGHIFATLASVKQGFGNLMLTPKIQAQFVEDAPDVFLPIAGGWGRMGATHIRLSKADRDVLAGALKPPGNCASRRMPPCVPAAASGRHPGGLERSTSPSITFHHTNDWVDGEQRLPGPDR